MADETSLLGFNLEQFIPCLMNCLRKEMIPDILSHNNFLQTFIFKKFF